MDSLLKKETVVNQKVVLVVSRDLKYVLHSKGAKEQQGRKSQYYYRL